MADELGHHATSGNWSSRSRSSSSAAAVNSSSMGSFGWPADSSMDSVSVSGSYHDTAHKMQGSDSTAGDPNLHMMGLGLSSQAMDWNQALLRGEKSEGSFRSILLEENGSFQHEQWRDSGDHSELKQINSLDNPQFSSGVYGTPSTILQSGLLGSESQLQHPHNSLIESYQYPNYTNNDLLPSCWANNKVPQFLRSSPPKQALQFSNNAPFWNAEVRPSFFPTLPSSTTPTFDDLIKPAKINMSEIITSTVVPKKSGETTSKRPRSDSPSPLPAFKVRKEKMGDRITALQQLVSPFGKTDTASVLSEAIEYIKFLHEQVNVLSTPYLKSGASIQHQQSCDHKSSKDPEGAKEDLRSKGLCLVPVSSTFPVAHETTVDFWTPTFGGTFR